METNWHTYWRSPGAAGDATKIAWELPAGVSAGATLWPVPEKLPDPDLTTYIYKDEVVLLTPLKLAAELPAGTLNLKAKVSWLECEVSCIPESDTVQAKVNVGDETKPSKDAPLLEAWLKKLPLSGEGLSAHAWWEKPATGDTRRLILEWDAAKGASEPDFFPDTNPQFEVEGPTEPLHAESGKLSLRKLVKKLSGDWPSQVTGLLVEKVGGREMAFEADLRVLPAAPGAALAASGVPAASLWQMLLYAFCGGLILNVMPCVLPVIALKILGFVAQAKDEPARIRKLGLIYAAGVLVSFLVLAGFVVGLKAAGRQAGWGMQFGNPEFLVVLTVLVTLVALNLFGLFEVNLSGRAMGAAGTLAARHGAAGAFFNGVLATVLATPCTAPFLSIALGFAFAQSPPVIVLMFVTVGLGLASPYVVLSWQPAWLKFLPKPGAWMQRFKVAMGFPMLATAFWLLSLIPIHYGERAWWLGFFLILVALAAWLFGEFFQRGSSRRGLALALTVVVLAIGYGVVLEGRLHWRSPEAGSAQSEHIEASPSGVVWQPWSAEAVASARKEGRPVIVDFTAKWCLTCNTLVKPALENQSVRDRLEQINALPLLGDYTRFPAAITEELKQFGRAGVPLILVYPKNPSEPPFVLPDPSPLRPPSSYSAVIVSYLERAVR